jgi:ABC-2 type transport system permease protein
VIRGVAIIAGKDLRQQVRNGTLLVFAVVLPLGLALLFNTIMGGEDRISASYAVLDQDGGALATAFTDQVLAAVAADGGFEIRSIATRDEAVRLTDSGELSATFVVPAGFTADIEAGRDTTLTVIGNPDAGIAVQIAREIAQAYLTELRGVQLAVAVGAAADPTADPQALAQQAAALPPPVTLARDDSADRRELDTATYFAAGMAVFFLFFTAMLSVSGLLQERTEGTMARLLASPVSRPAILAGKLLSTVAIGVVAMAVLVGASTLLLGASWGDPRGVAALVIATVLAATGLMALVASFARTTEQATNWMSVIAVLFGLFGGSFVPLAQLGALTAVSYAVPHRWFLLGLADLAGGGLGVVVVPVAALLGFAAVAFTLTLLRIGAVVRP